MSRSEFPKRRLLGVAAMALALAAFSAPVSAAGLGVSTGTQLGTSAAGVNVGTGINSSVETRATTSGATRNEISTGSRIDGNAELYQSMDPAVDIQMPEDPDGAYELRDANNTSTGTDAQTTSYSGTRLYSETEADAEAGVEAAQRTANAAVAVENRVEADANSMRASGGGTVSFNE